MGENDRKDKKMRMKRCSRRVKNDKQKEKEEEEDEVVGCLLPGNERY